MARHPDSTARVPRLLLVDTDGGVRFAMGDYLRRIGLEVDEAATPLEANAALARLPYHGLITDLRLSPASDREGLVLARRIRLLSPETAVCILTVPVEAPLMQEAEAVADAVLTRPRPLADLAQVVLALLHQSTAPRFTPTGTPP